jgi:hypothetical protein
MVRLRGGVHHNFSALQDFYAKLVTELLNRLSPTREKLLNLEEMDYCEPSRFLRHLSNFVTDVPNYILHSMWTNRLAPNVQTSVAGHPEVELYSAARCEDYITETVSPTALGSTGQPSDSKELLQPIEELLLDEDSALSGTTAALGTLTATPAPQTTALQKFALPTLRYNKLLLEFLPNFGLLVDCKNNRRSNVAVCLHNP